MFYFSSIQLASSFSVNFVHRHTRLMFFVLLFLAFFFFYWPTTRCFPSNEKFAWSKQQDNGHEQNFGEKFSVNLNTHTHTQIGGTLDTQWGLVRVSSMYITIYTAEMNEGKRTKWQNIQWNSNNIYSIIYKICSCRSWFRQNDALVYGPISIKCTSIDSSLDVLSNVFWVQSDQVNRWTAKSRKLGSGKRGRHSFRPFSSICG